MANKDTGVFLNKKNINEIIENGEFSENINKKNISSYDFKKVMENILNGKF